MIAYFDASALTKLFLDEPGSLEVQELWDSPLASATSELAIVELACTLASASRAGRLDAEPPSSALDGTFLSERAVLLRADPALVRDAASLGAEHGLRALDALHVASALTLWEAGPVLVSWDERQRRGAAAAGLPVYP